MTGKTDHMDQTASSSGASDPLDWPRHPAFGVTPNPAACPARTLPRQGRPLTDIEIERRIAFAVAERTKGLTERLARLEAAADLLAGAVAEHDQRFAAVSSAARKD